MDLREVESNSGNRHPWEISRASSVLSLINGVSISSIADIGSGDLYFAKKAIEITGKKGYACDVHYPEDPAQEEKKLHKVKCIEDIPAGEVDLVFLLDVLEHVENEEEFLRQVLAILQNGGTIVVTVPAFQCLFGDHDVFLKHYRRYNKKSLTQILLNSGLVIQKMHYFYSSLFVLRVVNKVFALLGIKSEYTREISRWKYEESHILTRILVFLLNTDFKCNALLNSLFKQSIPGLSICAIVKKPV